MKNHLKNMLKAGGVFLACIFLNCTSVYAEGSKELTSSGTGYRPYTEYDANTMAGVTRQTLLSVYAQEGEEILLGTSQWDSYDGNDIVVTDPLGNVTNIDVEAPYRYTGLSSWEYYEGHIATKEMEQAGPNYNGNNSNGYTPYIYNVNQTGIYTVCFHGEIAEGNNESPSASQLSNESGKFNPERSGYDLLGSFRKNDDTKATVAAWDISVYKNGEYVPGRVFTKYLSLNTGNSDTPVNSSVYILTSDGYEYKVDLNGVDPWGFIFYANNRGIVDLTNQRTVYKNAVAQQGETADQLLDLYGNLLAPRPSQSDYGRNKTYNIFFNRPASDLPSSMPVTPQESATFKIESVVSNANGTENETPAGSGFTAKVNFSKFCTYTMIVDVNQNGKYDSDTDAVIRNAASAGLNEIVWDGKTDSGAVVPGGTNVNIIIFVKTGEIHLPFFDVENNINGIKIELVNGNENIVSNNRNVMYYDNREYTTANGTVIGYELGLNPSAMSPSYHTDEGSPSPSGGADSTIDGSGAYSGDYGDNKIIDYWTYVRGYDDISEAQSSNSTYVKSDEVYDSVYTVIEDLKILNVDVEYGRINGFIYYDNNGNGTYDYEERDIAFTVSFPVIVVSRYGDSTSQRVVYSSETGGNFTGAIPLNSDGATDYDVYIIISGGIEEYIDDLKITEGGEFVTVMTDENFNIVSEGGTLRKAVHFTGSFENSYYVYHNIGLALAELPGASVSMDIDKWDYAVGDSITYIVKVANLDDNIDIAGVRVTVPILSRHSYLSYTGDTGTYDYGTGIWSIVNLPPNTTYELRVTSTIRGAGTYTAEVDFTAYNYDRSASTVHAEKEYRVQEEPIKEALFEFNDAKVTNDKEVIVVGELTGNNDQETLDNNGVNSIGFAASKDIAELQKNGDEFDINSVFYIECTEMYNKIYDTSGYSSENVPAYSETEIYNGSDKYYGAGIFEGMFEDMQTNGAVYYIQGITSYNDYDKLARENSIYEISLGGENEIQKNKVF